MNELDKKEKETRDLSQAVMQASQQDILDKTSNVDEKSVKQEDVEKLVNNDLNVIRSLMGIGAVSREEGHSLMKQVINKAYGSITKQSEMSPVPPVDSVSSDFNALDEFVNSNPEFFKLSGRDDVLSYLKNSKVKFDKDELLQISKLIETLENGAVDRYLKKNEYGKMLNDENNIAKQRLIANAQGANVADNNMVFTRSQIGQMSGDEFAKYEPIIMEQLKRGLIK